MSFTRGSRHSATGPVGRFVGWYEADRRLAVRDRLGPGSIACPRCDAPVSIGPEPVGPGHAVRCPFCSHAAALRDFLSLARPTRPARVVVRVRLAA